MRNNTNAIDTDGTGKPDRQPKISDPTALSGGKLSALKYLKISEVVQKTSLSKSHIYALIQQKRFPTPVSLSTNRVGWLLHEVDQWICDRMIAAQSKPA